MYPIFLLRKIACTAGRIACRNHRVHIEMKYGECICPLSWSEHCNFEHDEK
jgi:nitrite reductase/ring-hydroxylating ferredoxin subunit